jgi:hypothetical protein
VAGNNRRVQRRRKPRRRLFGKKAQEAFLESLACTGNVAASAAAVGFSEGAIYTKRRTDPEFRAMFWMALEQAAGKLAALRLQHEIERAERAQRSAAGGGSGGGGSGGGGGEGLEARMDAPPDPRQILDLVKLMAALRGLCRNLEGTPRTGGRAAESASIDETCRALAKRLRAFGVREGVAAPDPAEDGGGAV